MRKVLSRGALLLLFLCCSLCLSLPRAGGETGAKLTAEEWSWTGEDANVFHGTLYVDGAASSDALWCLEVHTNDPARPGTVVFTAINGQSLNRRKRSDQVSAALAEGENTFTAEWYPDREGVALNRATVIFRLKSAEGKALVSAELTCSTGVPSGDDPASRLLRYADRAVFWLLIAVPAVWVLAALRVLLLRRRRA